VNKKLNTVLFFLVATALNIGIVLVIALGLFIPFAFLLAKHLPGAVNLVVLVVIALGAMFGSFPIYRWLIGRFQAKVDMEKYFDPIVRTSTKAKRRD